MNQLTNNKPKIAAFVCNWCSYAGADAAGTSRLQYDDSVRIIRFPCTGRIDPIFIVKAFEQGADGVLVSGCHPGDCHYVSGNLYARRRFNIFRKLMIFLGLDERRLQFSWVSAAEGVKWAEVVNAVCQDVKQLNGQHFSWSHPKLHSKQTLNIEQTIKSKLDKEQIFTLDSPEIEKEETAITEELRVLTYNLLESKEVEAVLGYTHTIFPNKTVPFFATTPELTSLLVWNRYCVNNLTVYLTRKLVRKLGKIAIVVKACDAKALVGLLQENQINRGDIFIIGVACKGVIENNSVANKCYACNWQAPVVYDKMIGVTSNQPSKMIDPLEEEVNRLDLLSPQERWNFWQSQFARCIRCYACRAICPFCYCETCISDKHRPQWISTSTNQAGNLAWNIIRAIHLAGRCIGCGECFRVCPVNIRLDLINKKLALEIKNEFGYQPGLQVELNPPLATYRPDDNQEFIR